MEAQPSCRISGEIEQPVSTKRRDQSQPLCSSNIKRVKLSNPDEMPEMASCNSIREDAAAIYPLVSKDAETSMQAALNIPEIVELISSNFALEDLLVVRQVSRIFAKETSRFIRSKCRAIIEQKDPYKQTSSGHFPRSELVCPLLRFVNLARAKKCWTFPIKRCTLVIKSPSDVNIKKLLALNLNIDDVCLTEHSKGIQSGAAFLRIVSKMSTTLKHLTLCRINIKVPLNGLPDFPKIIGVTVSPQPFRYFNGIRNIVSANAVGENGFVFVKAFLDACPNLCHTDIPSSMDAEIYGDSDSD